MAKEFVISTSSINCYGFRVLTDGIDTEQFKKNPVLLYMHRRGIYGGDTLVLGSVADIRVDGDQLIGRPDFDMEDEFAAKIAHKWDAGHLRMCSAGIEFIESSSDPEFMVPGQTRPTVTKCKLVEVSIVDVGANDDALQLYAGGKVINLAAGADNDILPLLKAEPAKDTNDNQTNIFSMKNILLALGLADNATEAEALSAITKLQTDAERVASMELARIEAAVDAAVTANKLTADKRDKFIGLGKAAGYDHLQTALDGLTVAVKPTELINPGSGSAGKPGATELKYGEMSEAQLQEMKADDPDKFAKLFREHFGFELGSQK